MPSSTSCPTSVLRAVLVHTAQFQGHSGTVSGRKWTVSTHQQQGNTAMLELTVRLVTNRLKHSITACWGPPTVWNLLPSVCCACAPWRTMEDICNMQNYSSCCPLRFESPWKQWWKETWKRKEYVTSLAMQKVSFHWLIQKQFIAKAYTFTSNTEDNWCTVVSNNIFSHLI